jgi:hypothetical protein
MLKKQRRICSICGLRKAVIHFVEARAGAKKTKALCQVCFNHLAMGVPKEIASLALEGRCQYCGAKACVATFGSLLPFGLVPQLKVFCRRCAQDYSQFLLKACESMPKEVREVRELEKAILQAQRAAERFLKARSKNRKEPRC